MTRMNQTHHLHHLVVMKDDEKDAGERRRKNAEERRRTENTASANGEMIQMILLIVMSHHPMMTGRKERRSIHTMIALESAGRRMMIGMAMVTGTIKNADIEMIANNIREDSGQYMTLYITYYQPVRDILPQI